MSLLTAGHSRPGHLVQFRPLGCTFVCHSNGSSISRLVLLLQELAVFFVPLEPPCQGQNSHKANRRLLPSGRLQHSRKRRAGADGRAQEAVGWHFAKTMAYSHSQQHTGSLIFSGCPWTTATTTMHPSPANNHKASLVVLPAITWVHKNQPAEPEVCFNPDLWMQKCEQMSRACTQGCAKLSAAPATLSPWMLEKYPRENNHGSTKRSSGLLSAPGMTNALANFVSDTRNSNSERNLIHWHLFYEISHWCNFG